MSEKKIEGRYIISFDPVLFKHQTISPARLEEYATKLTEEIRRLKTGEVLFSKFPIIVTRIDSGEIEIDVKLV